MCRLTTNSNVFECFVETGALVELRIYRGRPQKGSNILCGPHITSREMYILLIIMVCPKALAYLRQKTINTTIVADIPPSHSPMRAKQTRSCSYDQYSVFMMFLIIYKPNDIVHKNAWSGF